MPPFQLLTFCFLAGICSLQFFAELPNFLTLTLFSFTTLFLTFILKKIRSVKNIKVNNKKTFLKFYHLNRLAPSIHYLTLTFLLGFLWMWVHCYQHLNKALPESIEGKPIVIVGKIASLPEVKANNTPRFEFQLK